MRQRRSGRRLQSAIDAYIGDHRGEHPYVDFSDDYDDDAALFMARMGPAGGRYLDARPDNPLVACDDTWVGTWNEDGSCDWRFDPADAKIRPDHPGAWQEPW